MRNKFTTLISLLEPRRKIKSNFRTGVNRLLVVRNVRTKTINKEVINPIKPSLPVDPVVAENEVEAEPLKTELPTTKLLNTVKNYQNQFPNYIILTRVGEFYELYYDQAKTVGSLLNMAVVVKKVRGHSFKFTGFPVRQLDKHLQTLLDKFKLSVCVLEQVQDPITLAFDRQVDRIYTSGTLVGESFLDGSQNNFLLSLVKKDGDGDGEVEVAYCDLACGETYLNVVQINRLEDEISRIRPKEILVEEDSELEKFFPKPLDCLVSKFSHQQLINNNSNDDNANKNESKDTDLNGAMDDNLALFNLVNYIKFTYGFRKGLRLNLKVQLTDPKILRLHQSTLNALELFDKSNPIHLAKVLNRTVTKPGSRLLLQRLAAPSTHLETIQNRFDLVQLFLDDRYLSEKLREKLMETKDLKRNLQKLSMNLATPQDLMDIRNTIATIKDILKLIQVDEKQLLNKLVKSFQVVAELGLDNTITELLAEGNDFKGLALGFVNKSFDKKLQDFYTKLDSLQILRNELELQLRTDLRSKRLKLTESANFGPVVETNTRDGNKIKSMETSPLRSLQTLKGKHRFYCKEWSSIHRRTETVNTNIFNYELELFRQVCQQTLNHTSELTQLIDSVAELDLATTMAHLTIDLNLVIPQLSDTSSLHLEGLRHLDVELSLRKGRKQFTLNDCTLTPQQNVQVVTGPNMGGKSTYLRSVAIATLMAQAGFPVACSVAKIGVVDSIFTRVGSADYLTKNLSTFMVEMQEASQILNEATDRSLVIIDEIGRGTTPREGQALAYAILKNLTFGNKSLTLFATHFLDLYKSIHNEHTRFVKTVVKKLPDGSYMFQHRLQPGIVTQSDGLLVAKMANLPQTTIDLAQSYIDDNKMEDRGIKDMIQELRQLEVDTIPDAKIRDLIRKWKQIT